MRLRYFLSWFFWSGITNAALDDESRAPARTILGVPRYLARRFLVGLFAWPAAAIAGNRARALDRLMDAAFAAGYAAKRWGFVTIHSAREPIAAGDAA